jgi:FkbM family methyltransferase
VRAERLAAAVGNMPRRMALELARSVHAPAAMDYKRESILLRRSSRDINKRLRSVRKEPFTVEWIEQFKPGDVFYDVGSNVGSYALIAAKASDQLVRTFAFEPSAPSYHDLCLNVVANGCADSVVPIPFGLWSHTTLIEFGHFSLAPGSSKHSFDFDEGRTERELAFRQRLPALSLDDAVQLFELPPPTHVKLDTEGSELRILSGASHALSNPAWRSILIETNGADPDAPAALEELVGPFGFALAESFSRPGRRTIYCLYARASAVS